MEINPNISKNTKEDRVLVERAQKGDKRAFDKLLRKYRKSVYYMLLKMVKNSDDAEDLAQEAFAKAFTSIERFDATFAFSTWLFRIASNNCIDFIRKKRVQTISIDQPVEGEDGSSMHFDLKDGNLDPNDALLKQQMGRYLKMALDRLPQKYRQLVELRYFEELSYEEVAEKTKLPLGTVKAQLFRARELLLEEMKDIEHEI
ncbi:MAG: sigma-70 family RNA polymerase sigma factor [Bacteroidia bacterium]|nr:sigma-70 family RNA polymerase sigma factor [Bacteroidia bacterium]